MHLWIADPCMPIFRLAKRSSSAAPGTGTTIETASAASSHRFNPILAAARFHRRFRGANSLPDFVFRLRSLGPERGAWPSDPSCGLGEWTVR